MLIPFEELFKRHAIQTTGVLHLGAHWGEEAEAYQAHGIRQVIWVEAVPSIHQHLIWNMSKFPKLASVCLQACLSDKDGEKVVFNVSNNQGQSSSFLEFGTHRKAHPTVRFIQKINMVTSRLDSLLASRNLEVGPGWFLNIDLQGAELLALKGMGELLWKFDHAYIEVNQEELYKGCALVQAIDEHMARYGFVGKETKMTGAGWGDKYYKRICQEDTKDVPVC